MRNQSLSDQMDAHNENRAMVKALKKEHEWCDAEIARLKRLLDIQIAGHQSTAAEATALLLERDRLRLCLEHLALYVAGNGDPWVRDTARAYLAGATPPRLVPDEDRNMSDKPTIGNITFAPGALTPGCAPSLSIVTVGDGHIQYDERQRMPIAEQQYHEIKALRARVAELEAALETCAAANKTFATINARIEAENARLREALSDIASGFSCLQGFSGVDAVAMVVRALGEGGSLG